MALSIRRLTHAAFMIKTEDTILFADLEKDSKVSEQADIILVSHSHADHFDPSKIKEACKSDTIIIAPQDCASKIDGSVNSIKPGEETTLGNIKVRAVEAYNFKRFRSPGKPYHPKGYGVGYIITVESKTIYHAGDTDFIPEMRALEHVDLALLPSGGTYTMDSLEAAEAALTINPKVAVPMHFWNTDPTEFKKRVEANSNIKVVVLKEGDDYQVI